MYIYTVCIGSVYVSDIYLCLSKTKRFSDFNSIWLCSAFEFTETCDHSPIIYPIVTFRYISNQNFKMEQFNICFVCIGNNIHLLWPIRHYTVSNCRNYNKFIAVRYMSHQFHIHSGKEHIPRNRKPIYCSVITIAKLGKIHFRHLI